MKKIVGILIALCMVFAVSGSAMAAFEYGANSSLALSITDKATEEFGFDLGILDVDFSLSDQNVVLADVGELDFVGDYVGIYSGTSNYKVTVGLGTDVDPGFNVGPVQNYINTYWDIAQFGYSNTSPAYIAPSDPKSYTTKLSGGSYAGLYSWTAKKEVVLDWTEGYTDVYMYSYDLMAGTYDTDSFIRIYENGSAVLNPNAVPVPAAVWMLGSGLLGLVGIRRKNS